MVVNMLPGCIFDSAVMFRRHDLTADARAGRGCIEGPIRRAVGYFPREHMSSQSRLFDLNETKTGRKRASKIPISLFQTMRSVIKPSGSHLPKCLSNPELECLRSGLRVYYEGTKRLSNQPWPGCKMRVIKPRRGSALQKEQNPRNRNAICSSNAETGQSVSRTGL
jgi:hypothetical protein